MDQADAVILGSGQGGVPLAVDLSRDGKRVTLFERGRLGGSCVNYGCTPSKAFLGAAHVAGRARAAAPLGIHAEIRVDFPAVMARVRSVRDSFTNGVEKRLTRAGVNVVRAGAEFTGERTISADGAAVQGATVVINTGTSAAVPPIPGLAGTPFLTNENFFELEELPRRTLVLGGGYVGLELGQGLARLGSTVHIIDHNARVLAREEADVSAVLQTSLARDGVQLHLGRDVTHVAYDGGLFTLALDDHSELCGEALLVAVGRSPNTAALNAKAAGVTLDARGMVAIDERFRTSAQGVYAIADVAGQPAFTHVSWEDYRRLKAILSGGDRRRDDRVLGYAVYTEPQVGRVGMTIEDAKRSGLDARSVDLPVSHVARAIEWGHDLGFYRLVVEAKTDRILGATLVGYEAAEVVHVVLAHMEAHSTWRVLERSVHIHPTYGEALPSLARLLLDT
ncbi:dihydrolipoyl dehydrogenase [bacterium]|nr:MAG: dihydrolipoyl dehydrogenase [bacterium]